VSFTTLPQKTPLVERLKTSITLGDLQMAPRRSKVLGIRTSVPTEKGPAKGTSPGGRPHSTGRGWKRSAGHRASPPPCLILEAESVR